MKRSVKIDLIPPAEMRQKIIASIRITVGCRQCIRMRHGENGVCSSSVHQRVCAGKSTP
jgi:hypothetical protein